MDRESLNDYPLGKYDVTVTITQFEQDKHIEWTISGVIKPPASSPAPSSNSGSPEHNRPAARRCHA